MDLMALAIGIAFGAAFLAIFWRWSNEALANMAFASLATMLGIYIGAYLVSSDLTRVLYETLFFSSVVGLALFFQSKWHPGIALLILCHGAYDFLFGHSSGVADWYPPLCVGFDLIVGSGLTYRFLLSSRKTQNS